MELRLFGTLFEELRRGNAHVVSDNSLVYTVNPGSFNAIPFPDAKSLRLPWDRAV